VAESAWAAFSGLELINLDKLSACDGRDNKLCNALLRYNCNGVLSEVDQDNFDLAAIIGVNRARRIHQREPFIECAATSGPYLTFKPGRYFKCNSSRDGGTGEWLKHHRFVERRKQINPCGVFAVIARHGSTQALNFDDRNNQQIKWTLLLGAS
jgi:hypothetical protein